MRPDDLALLSVPSSPTLHGDLLVVAVASPDPVKNEYRGGLARIPLADGESPRRWSWDRRDSAPVLSPDGRWLAFLRAVPPEDEPTKPARPQVHVRSVAGGDARRLTNLPGGAGAPVWSPDSRRLAFTSRTPEPGRYGTTDEEWPDAPDAGAEAPRRITRMDYRIDNVGYLADQHSRLYVQDAPDLDDAVAEPLALTDGRCDVADPTWSPDAAHIIFLAPRDLGVQETVHDDVYAVPAAGGDPVLVVRTTGFAEGIAVGEAGDIVFFCAVNDAEGRLENVSNWGLWTAPFRLDGPAPARRLTDGETVDCEPAAGRPVVTGDTVLAAVRNRGAVELRRIPLAGDQVPLADLPVLLGERAAVKGFTAYADRIAAIVSTPDSPGEVVLLADGAATTLTDFAAPLRAAGIRPVRELTGTGSDGYPVHGWLVLPEGPGPYPVVLCVHGGPFMYYGWGFFDEAQMYASAGYAVVMGNPRGSAGYGQAHGRSIVHALGTVDTDDVLAVLDLALALPECDAEQVGVMGGSYGGYMTSWLAAHHGERFRAAWSERALNAWDSFSGSSDIGYVFTDLYVGPDLEEQRRRSPLTYADQIRIPFAVVHSEHDLRCPLEQAQRMFVALRRNGTEAEMLVFPGEGHELTRTGKPRHRVQRFRAVLDWWSRHLKAR